MELSREIKLIERISADTVVSKDMVSFLNHGTIVSMLAGRIARELGEPEEFCEEMEIAGMLHDIGKLRVASYLYGEDEELHVSRLKHVRMHPSLGNDVLRSEGIYSERLISYIASHHENYDGTGYPNHLEGEEIPYGARILRVCDMFAALVANRSYRAAFSIDAAIDIMIHEVKNFDMRIFLAFLSVVHTEDFGPIEAYIARARKYSAYLRRQAEKEN